MTSQVVRKFLVVKIVTSRPLMSHCMFLKFLKVVVKLNIDFFHASSIKLKTQLKILKQRFRILLNQCGSSYSAGLESWARVPARVPVS